MVTTQANEIMSYVYNHKLKNAIVLKREDKKSWLDNSNNISKFAFPYEVKIIAFQTI
ncbi:hypothetical protein FLA105535_02611 [Flavobacterium bizetiae]|nr:hypothetical protein FLA105535_02611 [Flavobacterium bizetiae]CAD5348158.1 hypothetical protein FLA105534_02117 [Flavobacterium bizetiae]